MIHNDMPNIIKEDKVYSQWFIDIYSGLLKVDQ